MVDDAITRSVTKWVESFVVGNNLCPFAKRELMKRTVRFTVTPAETEEQLLIVLQSELELLSDDLYIETTLLIHPETLRDFHDYNQFLNEVDALLVRMELVGIYQIASFHPHYQFADTGPDDAENYSNRSPHPMLHILREESVERAIAGYPDVDRIPARNVELLNSLGPEALRAAWRACLSS